MAERTEGKSWDQFLPTAYSWLDKLVTASETQLVDGACHIVAVKKGPDERIELSAPQLANDLKDKILKQCDFVGWKGKSTTQQLAIDGKLYLLCVVSSLDVAAPQKARQFGIDAVAQLKDLDVQNVVLVAADDLDPLDVFEGVTGGYYQPGFFKTGNNKKSMPAKIGFLGKAPNAADVKNRILMMKAQTLVKMLQDAPPNWLNSELFGEIAAKLFKDSPANCTVMGREEMRKLGMGSFLSVGEGSVRDPKFICIEIAGVDPSKTVALVGKGVTFDSGGINIKPSTGLNEMKYDMSGAAAVLGSALYLSQVKPPVNVVCAIGAVENMPSGTASRPGDVVQAYNGKTIEILNTDAEGRLVLCDLMAYVCDKFKPALMIDIATLTGAVMHGLGHCGAALLTGSDKTAAFMAGVAARSGEPVWRLPLWPELAKETKGEVADLKNIAKPNVLAGTIMGGMFLKEFVDETKTQWAHLDIAGTGWSCAATGFPANGASAFGLRLMVRTCFEFVN